MIKKIKAQLSKRYEEVLLYLILLINFLTFFQYLSSVFTTVVLIVILGIVIFRYIDFDKKKFKITLDKEIKPSVICMLLFCMFIFFSSKMIGNTQNLISLNANVLITFVVALVLNESYTTKNLKRPIKFYSIAMIILLILSILMNLENTNRGIMNFFSRNYDPNYMCSSFLLLFFLQFKNLLENKNSKVKYINAIILLMILFFCLLSGSRGITIALLVGGLTYLILYLLKNNNLGVLKSRKLKRKKSIKIFVGVSLLLVALAVCVMNFVPASTLERFEFKNLISLGGRTGIWLKALDTFWQAPLLNKLIGYGTGSFLEVVNHFEFGQFHVSHNVFINILIENGLIGLILFSSVVVIVFREVIIKKDYFSIGLLIANILLYMTLDMCFSYWVNIIICSIILKDNANERKS